MDPLPGRASLRKRWGAPLASLIQNGPPSRVKPSPLVSPRFPRSENWRHIFPLLHCEEEKQSRGESHKRALLPEFLQQRLIRAFGHGDAEHDFHRARLAALIDAHVALKKRTFRSLWITRINAAVRAYGMTYSEFIGKVNAKGIAINRKVMADLAMNEPKAFEAIVKAVK